MNCCVSVFLVSWVLHISIGWELREGTEGVDLADAALQAVLLNICQENPSTGLRVLLLRYAVRKEELESYHCSGEMGLCRLCLGFAKAFGPWNSLLYTLSR